MNSAFVDDLLSKPHAARLFSDLFDIDLSTFVGRDDDDWPVVIVRDTLAEIESDALRNYAQIRNVERRYLPVSTLCLRDARLRAGGALHDMFFIDAGDVRLATAVAHA